MTRDEKRAAVAELKEKFENNDFFYITDSSTLTVEEVNNLRRICFEKGVEFKVVKNTLVKKALESMGDDKYAPLYDVLHGPTSLMFCETSNVPAKVIKDFRKKKEKPALKAAYIDAGIYIGDHQIEDLTKLKSKEELLGEVIGLLQSPAKNVIAALQSAGIKLAAIMKTISEKE